MCICVYVCMCVCVYVYPQTPPRPLGRLTSFLEGSCINYPGVTITTFCHIKFLSFWVIDLYLVIVCSIYWLYFYLKLPPLLWIFTTLSDYNPGLGLTNTIALRLSLSLGESPIVTLQPEGVETSLSTFLIACVASYQNVLNEVSTLYCIPVAIWNPLSNSDGRSAISFVGQKCTLNPIEMYTQSKSFSFKLFVLQYHVQIA